MPPARLSATSSPSSKPASKTSAAPASKPTTPERYPLDLLKEEQDRLARQLDLVTARLDALDSTYDEARTHLALGRAAGRGDVIVTRDNDRRLSTGKRWVKNGDAWTVIESHEDGSLTVPAIVGGESFGALVAQLRRTEAEGHQPEQLLTRAVRAGGLDDARDPAAVLAARLAKLTAARSGGTRPRRRPRYITGLIPEATGTMPADMHRALTEPTGPDRAARRRARQRSCPRGAVVGAQPAARPSARRRRRTASTSDRERRCPAAARTGAADRLGPRPQPVTVSGPPRAPA